MWVSKELINKIKRKRNVYDMWEKGLSSWDEYRRVVRACRDVTRKAKAHLEVKLSKEIKDNNKCFFVSLFLCFFPC